MTVIFALATTFIGTNIQVSGVSFIALITTQFEELCFFQLTNISFIVIVQVKGLLFWMLQVTH